MPFCEEAEACKNKNWGKGRGSCLIDFLQNYLFFPVMLPYFPKNKT